MDNFRRSTDRAESTQGSSPRRAFRAKRHEATRADAENAVARDTNEDLADQADRLRSVDKSALDHFAQKAYEENIDKHPENAEWFKNGAYTHWSNKLTPTEQVEELHTWINNPHTPGGAATTFAKLVLEEIKPA